MYLSKNKKTTKNLSSISSLIVRIERMVAIEDSY